MTSAQVGQAMLGLLVAGVGFILNRRAKQIHVLVNSRLDQALQRISSLESKLGLSPGEPIPAPPILTTATKPEPGA